jgi:hypothetical protein
VECELPAQLFDSVARRGRAASPEGRSLAQSRSEVAKRAKRGAAPLAPGALPDWREGSNPPYRAMLASTSCCQDGSGAAANADCRWGEGSRFNSLSPRRAMARPARETGQTRQVCSLTVGSVTEHDPVQRVHAAAAGASEQDLAVVRQGARVPKFPTRHVDARMALARPRGRALFRIIEGYVNSRASRA